MQVKLPFSGLRRTVMHSLFINYHSLIAIQIHSYVQYHFCFAEMILLKADTLGYAQYYKNRKITVQMFAQYGI